MELYNRKNIVEFLRDGFDIEGLHNLCFVSDDFYPIYNEWSGVTQKSKLIRELVDFAIRQELIKSLLEEAGKQNPGQYRNYQKDKPFYDLEQAKKLAADERHTMDNLKKFFSFSENDPSITIYLSRHSASTQLPVLPINSGGTDHDPILGTLRTYQQWEESQMQEDPSERQSYSSDKFAVVSAVEVLEAQYLKEELEKSRLRDLIPYDEQREELLRTDLININLSVCPEPDAYGGILGNGTAIFIGGPRANLGTYYYLYGYSGKAGVVRPGRSLKNKNVIECINNPENKLECDAEHNLAIIQKHRIVDNNKTIIYLAGTGANGTAAAVAYLRQSWLKLLNRYKDNFTVIIKVPGGKVRQENFTRYGRDYWNVEKWDEMEIQCD